MDNKFNRKKNQQMELNRLQHVYKKPNVYIPIIKHQMIPFNKSNIDIPNNIQTPTIYKFNNTIPTKFIPTKSIPTKFNIDLSRENHYDKIPKISFKEVPIPHYSQTDKFDLNTIKYNISSPINMDIFASDKITDADINLIKKKGISKIIHVYQQKYKSDIHPTGFGDFIRGCFFIIQFCTKFNFDYNIMINHPISKFFKNFPSDNSIPLSNNNNIVMFTESNFDKCVYDEENYIQNFKLTEETFKRFLNYLYSLQVIDNSVFSYNILFPYHNITIELREKMRVLFEPSCEISDKIDEILSSLHLVKNRFSVLHIRSGDSYLINNKTKFDPIYFQTITDEITKFLANNSNNNILLIADNNIIKVLLNQIFPNIKFLIHDITHIGEGTQLQEEKVKNTMIDFFLMANSSSIFSLTSYTHGTGFSYWCSKIYNIPYQSKFVNVT
jgi:hypothetical protein